MNKDMINRFIGKDVKIVKYKDFVLHGQIVEIDGDFILFKTETRTSMIHLDTIREITPDY